MKKISILLCKKVSDKCSASGYLKAFNKKIDAFESYNVDIELASFTHCSRCEEESEALLEKKIKRMKTINIEAIHLSSCIRGRCPRYEAFVERFSKDFDVIGYTHGRLTEKKKTTSTKRRQLHSA